MFIVIWHVHQVLLKFICQWNCWVNKILLVRPFVNYYCKHYIYCFFLCVRSSRSGIFAPSCNLNPLNPKIKIGILICSPYSFRIDAKHGHPTTVFCKISVRRSKYCLQFSFIWGQLKFLDDRSIHVQFSEINSLRFSKVSLIFHISLPRLG